MNIIKGDLLALAKQGKFDVIVHGCNCFHTMGGGIARQIKVQFPSAYDADLKTPYGDPSKVGTYSSVLVGIFFIVNAYTQFSTSGFKDVFEYDGFQNLLNSLVIDFPDEKFGFPMIGAGLAGGDWTRISAMIENTLGDRATIVEYVPQRNL